MKAFHMISTSLLFLIMFTSKPAVGSRSRMEQDILDKLFEQSRYDRRIRPSSGVNGTGDGDPTVVRVNTMIRRIEYIDDIKMEYRVQVTLRQKWTDERLVFDDLGGKMKYLTISDADLVWKPDIFIKNEISGNFHNIVAPNRYIRIFSDGKVLYSTRITLTLSCPMDLKDYPMDKQQCQMLVASYGYTTEDIALLWEDINPVQITRHLHLPRFVLMKFITDYCNSKTNTGEYSCLVLALFFDREISYYLVTIYIPCSMLVIVAWVSFWLDRNALSARMVVVLLTLYVMTWMSKRVNESLAPVSYTKAIDIWMGMCNTFVFCAVIQCALVNYLSQSGLPVQLPLPCQSMKKQRHQGVPENTEETDKAITVDHPAHMHEENSKSQGCGRMIDIVSRVAYPLIFVLFNIIYWSTYLSANDEDSY